VWRGGSRGEEELLRACYRNSLELAREHGLRSIAFPAISCGIYGYPVEKALRCAVAEVRAFIEQDPSAFDRVIFVCFDKAVCRALRAELPGT